MFKNPFLNGIFKFLGFFRYFYFGISSEEETSGIY